MDLSFYRGVLEKTLYRGTATIEIREAVKNKETGKSENKISTVYEDLPCLLSHATKDSAREYIPEAGQEIDLFIGPDILIPPESKITVTQDGVTVEFGYSGITNRFPGHQELKLKKWTRWA